MPENEPLLFPGIIPMSREPNYLKNVVHLVTNRYYELNGSTLY